MAATVFATVLLALQLLTFLACRLAASPTEVKYTTGNFSVVYSTNSLPVFRVYDARQRLIWFTSENSKSAIPVVASSVERKVTQNGGIFNIKTVVKYQCTQAQILSHEVVPGTDYPQVVFRGTLCNESDYSLSFEASDVKETSRNGITVFQHLVFNLTVANSHKFNQIALVYGCDKDEGFFGFGFQYTKFNAKGHRLPLFSTEQGVGRGLEPITAVLDVASHGAGGTWYTTYTHIAQYISSRMRSLMLHSLEYTVFDFTKSTVVTVEINSTVMIGRILAGTTPLELITSYTSLVGRMPLLPEWTNRGAVLGLEGGTKKVMDRLVQIKSVVGSVDDIAAVWLQDWTGERRFNNSGHDISRVGLWWNWELDSTHYPNWSEMVANLTSKGIRVLTYVNCLLTDVSQRGTPYKRNLYKEALENGYLVKLSNGKEWEGYSEGYMVDLTNPSAYKWMLGVLQQEMLGINVSGWMADFGESLPLDANLYSGDLPAAVHSVYPQLWAKANEEAIETFKRNQGSNSQWNNSDIVFFMRSASTYSPSYSRLFWLGDQLVTWDHYDGLQTAITGMLSGGLSGLALVHSDIGGYTTLDISVLKYERSKELFMRWTELAAFTPFFRTHPGSLPEVNWQFDSDKETLLHFFKMVKVFKAWGFYREQLMQEVRDHGWPIARHLMLVYPTNPKIYKEDLSKQFMLGEELLVAPSYRKSSFYIDVFLPGGEEWVHVWTNTTYLGGNAFMNVPAPVGEPCVLYRKGSSIGQQFQKNVLEMTKLN